MKTDNKKPSSRHYNFGTFEDRLEHICLLFGAKRPAIEYDRRVDSKHPLLADGLMGFIERYEVCMDWLFIGSPDGLLKHWASRKNSIDYISAEMHNLDADGLRELLDSIEKIQAARKSND